MLQLTTALSLVLMAFGPDVASAQDQVAPAVSESSRVPRMAGLGLGILLTELTPELRQDLGAPVHVGVMVGLVPIDTPGAAAGLEVGDVVIGLDGGAIATGSDLRQRMQGLGGREVTLDVIRAGETIALEAALPEVGGARLPREFQFERLEELDGFPRGSNRSGLPASGGDVDELRVQVDELEAQLLELTESMRQVTEEMEKHVEPFD